MEHPAKQARGDDPFLTAIFCASAFGLVLSALCVLWICSASSQGAQPQALALNSMLVAVGIVALEFVVFRAVMQGHTEEDVFDIEAPA